MATISLGCLPPFIGSNMALLTGESPLPAGVPLSSPMLAPGGSTPDMVYFGTTRPLVRPGDILAHWLPDREKSALCRFTKMLVKV